MPSLRARFPLTLLILVMAASSPLSAQARQDSPDASPATFGGFLVMLAEALHLPPPDDSGFTEMTALAALAGQGFDVVNDTGARLTEAQVVGFLTHLGYRVSTTTPSRLVSEQRARELLEIFVEPLD